MTVVKDGALESLGSCTLEQDGCSTCGDTAVPVRVIDAFGTEALVEDRLGHQATVATDLIEHIRQGDILLIHMGIALARVGDHCETGR